MIFIHNLHFITKFNENNSCGMCRKTYHSCHARPTSSRIHFSKKKRMNGRFVRLTYSHNCLGFLKLKRQKKKRIKILFEEKFLQMRSILDLHSLFLGDHTFMLPPHACGNIKNKILYGPCPNWIELCTNSSTILNLICTKLRLFKRKSKLNQIYNTHLKWNFLTKLRRKHSVICLLNLNLWRFGFHSFVLYVIISAFLLF